MSMRRSARAETVASAIARKATMAVGREALRDMDMVRRSLDMIGRELERERVPGGKVASRQRVWAALKEGPRRRSRSRTIGGLGGEARLVGGLDRADGAI